MILIKKIKKSRNSKFSNMYYENTEKQILNQSKLVPPAYTF